MSTMRALDLVQMVTATLGTGGALDLKWAQVEECYAALRELDWSWNWKSTPLLGWAAASETAPNDFLWSEGDTYILSQFTLNLGYRMTGRMVQLGDYWYRVVNYGGTDPNRVYVDRPISGSQTTLTTCPFYRAQYVFPTSTISAVHVREEKLRQYTEESWERLFYSRIPTGQMSVGSPTNYFARVCLDETTRLAPPEYPLVVTSSGAGTMANGTYIYFATRYCPESGAESPPGPLTTVTVTDGFARTVTYGNTVTANVGESTTYAIRYYRSAVNPVRARTPMYLIKERPPTATLFADSTASIPRDLPRYYGGQVSEVCLFPFPDVREPIRVRHVRCWGGRPGDDDQLPLGTENAFIELVRLHLSSLENLQGRDTPDFRAALMAYRRQQNYHIGRSRNAATSDYSSKTYDPWVPGGDSTEADPYDNWVDRLPGPG